jgi:YidC/Oxa1 family membrane protein insertase
MPIWFALYATLQTAVEFYKTPFLWFPDLSAPDQLFFPPDFHLGPIPLGPLGPLPLILGAAMIVQQRIVPQQGMDPVQQKMMTWLMPAIFTVMMLFLPAALGVYMLTNSLLGITQQLVVEKLFPRGGPEDPSAKAESKSGGDIAVKKDKPGRGTPAPALRKGKARV